MFISDFDILQDMAQAQNRENGSMVKKFTVVEKRKGRISILMGVAVSRWYRYFLTDSSNVGDDRCQLLKFGESSA